jgi:hypothetical protein
VAFEELKDKYKRLQQLRETDAERNLSECRAQLEENIQSAANYRAKIEPQLECKLPTYLIFRDSSRNGDLNFMRMKINIYNDAAEEINRSYLLFLPLLFQLHLEPTRNCVRTTRLQMRKVSYRYIVLYSLV